MRSKEIQKPMQDLCLAILDGVKYYVGNEKLMKEHCNDFKETNVIGTAIYCCSESELMGNIVFADIIKQDSKDALKALKKLGIAKTVMMTGDKKKSQKILQAKPIKNSILTPDA